ncbi:MAG: RagB/SusD family nutrient uptake outer membrane protein [Prevotellaceae bacterium]|nr:RagB/SusD family nutrient uptake outer membrane protein [Prevotellaceae bacterium]
MNSKLSAKVAILFCGMLGLSGCNEWLSEPQPAKPDVADFFIAGGGTVAVQVVNAAYVPLQWEYGSTYCPEWWIGDVASDDALKGGQNTSDMSAAYELDNFRISNNNAVLLDWYQLNFHGIARCNFAVEQLPSVAPDAAMSERAKERLTAEAKFLRALYYFRLVRVFGEVPLVTYTIQTSDKWRQPKASVESIYAQIFRDLEDANAGLWPLSELRQNPADVGRATKGAAQAMLLKAHLYYAQWSREHYATAKAWGDSIIADGEYSLEEKYADNFSIYNENGKESVFEVQYAEEASSDYGSFNPHFGGTRGTFTTILTRSRSDEVPKKASGGSTDGWGFNKPTQSLYDEFEAGDARREASILNLYAIDSSLISNPAEEIYMGSAYLTRKYAIMDSALNALWDGHATRAPINIKLIRYADVLLMYAEACNETGDFAAAKSTLNALRAKRRAECADPATQLPDFPYLNHKTAQPYADSQDGLREAIRHERRVELAMESHRWFDLVRWGAAKEAMSAYKAAETPQVQAAMNDFTEGKNEYFPLPQYELDLSGLEQSEKWK